MEHASVMRWLLETLDQIKVFHWNTKSYAAHKALDEFHEKLSELADEFVEVFIGKMGPAKVTTTLKMDGITTTANTKIITTYIERFCESARAIHKELGSHKGGASELQNILDEMMSLANKTVYLLTLQ
jgi:DNA-binding ferritin-like protein